MAQVGSLYTSLTLESASFISGLKKAADAADRQSRVMERAFGAAKGAFAGFVSAVTVGSIVAAGQRALDYAASLGEVAQQLGISTDALQTYQFAATQAGLSQDEMRSALQRLTRTLGEAKVGGDSAVRAFRAIGITGRELANLTTEQAMRRIADAVASIPDPTKRAALEVEFFGKAGQKLDTMLAGGSAAIDGLAASANQLGIVLSAEQIQKADETADKLAALKTVLEARIAGVVADNADSILKLADAVGKLADQASRMSSSDWARIAAGAAGGAVLGAMTPIPGGTIIGGIAGAGAVWNGRAAANDAALARMPGTPLGGVSFDPKTGKFIGLGGAPTPPAPTLDLEALNRRDSSKKAKDPIAESLKRALPGKEAYKEYVNDLKNAAAAQAAGRITADEYSDAIGRIGKSYRDSLDLSTDSGMWLVPIEAADIKLESVEDSLRAINELPMQRAIAEWGHSARAATERLESFATNLTDGLGQAIILGEGFGSAMVRSIKAAAAEMAASGLMDLLMGRKNSHGVRSGGLLSAGIAAVGSLFRGPRAAGGPVAAGSAYLVGERGPEPFFPGRSGTILPNSALRGIRGRDAATDVKVHVSMDQGLKAEVAVIGARSGEAAAAQVLYANRPRPRLPGRL